MRHVHAHHERVALDIALRECQCVQLGHGVSVGICERVSVALWVVVRHDDDQPERVHFCVSVSEFFAVIHAEFDAVAICEFVAIFKLISARNLYCVNVAF